MRNDNTYHWVDYENDIVKAALPWIIFGILAFIVLIVAIVMRFLRCVCCKQQLKERGRCIKLTCVISSFIVTFLGLLTCSFLIYYSDQTFQSLQQVQCASGRIPYTLFKGNQPKGWAGLNQNLINNQNVSRVLQQSYTNATDNLWQGTDSWLIPGTFQNALQAYYTTFNQATVNSSNPLSPNDSLLTTYTSKLGPLNDSTTFSGQINTEYLERIAPIIQSLIFLKNSTEDLEENLNLTIKAFNNSFTNLTTFYQGTQEINTNVNYWVVNNEDQIISSWRSFTFGVVIWGWFICIGVLITVYTQAMAKPSLAHGLCCFWLLTGMMTVVGFLASAGSLGVGLVVRDTCGLLDDLFTSTGITTYDLVIPINISMYADTCLNKDGNLIPDFNLNDSLAFFTMLSYENNSLANAGISIGLSNFVSINNNVNFLAAPINYSQVLSPSVNQTDTSDYNLNELNKFTNNFTAGTYQHGCNFAVSDLWVFYSNNCSTYTHITSTTPNQLLGKKACLVISEWSENTVMQRYEGLNCSTQTTLGNISVSIEEYWDALYMYEQSVNSLYQNMSAQLLALNSTLETLVNEIVPLYSNVVSYFTSPTQLKYLFDSTLGTKGLQNGLNCSYINGYSSTLKSAMCTNALENVYEVFVFIFVLSFFMLLLELLNLYLSRALLKGVEVY